MMGLIEPGRLDPGERYDADRSGSGGKRSALKDKRSGSGRSPVGGVSGSGRSMATGAEIKRSKVSGRSGGNGTKKALIGEKKNEAAVSYPASVPAAGGLN